MTDFSKFKFVVEERRGPFAKRRVYKHSEAQDIFTLVSPKHRDEPEWLSKAQVEYLIRDKKFIPYTSSPKVHELLNTMWENYSEEWEHGGKMYEVDLSHSITDAPSHGGCKVGYHHGRLVWVSGFQYAPTVCYCKFENFEKKPDWSCRSFTKMHNIHPVWCFDDNSML